METNINNHLHLITKWTTITDMSAQWMLPGKPLPHMDGS